MASILLKNIPPQIHQRLKKQAKKSRRSMTQEVLYMIEEGLNGHAAVNELPVPYGGLKHVSDEQMRKWIREGRE
jgi:plasmid stability protein